MSTPDLFAHIGQPVYTPGDDGETGPARNLFSYLGETDGTHYYAVTDDAGTHVYPAERLHVMTANGPVPLLEYYADTAPAPVAYPAPDSGEWGEYHDFLRWRAAQKSETYTPPAADEVTVTQRVEPAETEGDTRE